MQNKKAQAGIVVLVITIIIGIILLVGVAVPIISATVSAQNFTGVNATIGDNLTTFALIGALVLIAGLAIFGFGKK